MPIREDILRFSHPRMIALECMTLIEAKAAIGVLISRHGVSREDEENDDEEEADGAGGGDKRP